MDVLTAQLLMRHMERKMRESGKSMEALFSEYEGTISPEYAADLRELIAEAESVLKCPIQDF